MRHRKKGNKLGRERSHRKALLANLVTNLILHEKIETTLPKAKEARRFAERMITFAKKGDLAARRHVMKFIKQKEAVLKLFDSISGRYQGRNGGYTRVIKLGNRLGDNAPMALLSLLEETKVAGEEKGKTKSQKKAKSTSAEIEVKKDKKAKEKKPKEKKKSEKKE